MLEQKIQDDLKTAMLAGDKQQALTLRSLKSVILYAKVANGTRDEVMSDDDVVALFIKEAKKRQESADLYVQGGSQDRADNELTEKEIIQRYLPAQVSEADIAAVVDEVMAAAEDTSQKSMGVIISAVKAKLGAGADGGMIAKLVRERIGK